MYQGNNNRVNVDIGGSKTIYNIIGSSGAANVSIKIYGTSVDSEYLSTTLTGLDTNPNLASLLINTYQADASATTLLSLDQESMFKYLIILVSYINGSWLTLNLSFSTGGLDNVYPSYTTVEGNSSVRLNTNSLVKKYCYVDSMNELMST